MKAIQKFLEKMGVPVFLVSVLLMISSVSIFIIFAPHMLSTALVLVFGTAPVWLPVLLFISLWKVWILYIRSNYIAKQETTVLEVRIPKNVDKSPRAMEAVFAGIHVGLGGGTIDRLTKGNVRNWFSFEIASLGGHIHFYIWTSSFFKDIIEAQIYAQYPDVEIYEVEDYAKKFKYDAKNYDVWGCNFKLTNDDAFPIKTYIDYELDKDPKEEYKIDPIAHMFEYLSTAKEGEQIWIQIIIRTNKDERHKKGTFFGKEKRWKTEAIEKIEDIKSKATPKAKTPDGNNAVVPPVYFPSQVEQIKAIERSLDKSAFDVGIRALHIGKRGSLRGINTVGMLGIFKQFSSEHLNGFGPFGWFTQFSYPWQDYSGKKRELMKYHIIDAYKRRSWFHPPYETPHYVLTTEELATIYHFPSRIVQAPGIERIPATKSKAPVDLPV